METRRKLHIVKNRLLELFQLGKTWLNSRIKTPEERLKNATVVPLFLAFNRYSQFDVFSIFIIIIINLLSLA